MNVQRLPCPTFSAKEFNPSEARAFLDQFDNYATAYALTDPVKLQTMSTALTDNALSWFLRFKTVTTGDDFNWNTFRTQFIGKFTAQVPRANGGLMMFNCKQKPGETVRTFIDRCFNLAKELQPTPRADQMKTMTAQIVPDNAAAGAPAVPITWTLREEDRTMINTHYIQEKAIDLFLYGCFDKVRQAILLNKTWETLDQLEAAAIAVEQSVMPTALSAQLTQYGAPKAAVCFMSDGTTSQYAQPQEGAAPPAAPICTMNHGHKGKKQSNKKKQSSSSSGDRQYKAKPHPNQHETHTAPVTCYYCGGQKHTERHCLAKKAAAAAQPVSNIHTQSGQPPLSAPPQPAQALQQGPHTGGPQMMMGGAQQMLMGGAQHPAAYGNPWEAQPHTQELYYSQPPPHFQ